MRRKYPDEGDDSTLNEDEGHIMRAGYTNNYGYGATTEVMAPTASENERGTPSHGFPKEYVPEKILHEERTSPDDDFHLPIHSRHAHSPGSESQESMEPNGRVVDDQARFEKEQRAFMMELVNKGSKVVQVTYPRTANNEKELTVARGEFLEVIDDNRKWWKTRNIEGKVGHIPHTIVTPTQGIGGSPQVSPKSADWIQKERRGKKGEFRYF